MTSKFHKNVVTYTRVPTETQKSYLKSYQHLLQTLFAKNYSLMRSEIAKKGWETRRKNESNRRKVAKNG